MIEQTMNTQRLSLAIMLAASLLLLATNAQAEEQRCSELNANCICSEPFEMASFSSGPDFWNPTDSSTKQCSVEQAVVGGAIVRTGSDVTASTDATALAALPPGHSVSRFVRAGNDHQGTFYAGNGIPVSSSFVRLAARWYVWHTPTFDFAGESTCNNSKIAEFNNDSRVDYIVGSGFHTYNYLNFAPAIDCCVSGPGPSHGVATSQMKGKWWRFEAVLTNRSGPNYNMKFYGKNVTDNGPELTLIDLATNGSVDSLTPPSLMSQILSNNHRWSAAGGCRGWIGISHYMMAGWTTNSAQRIGAASEVEGGGGGGDTTPPVPPTNLRVTQLIEE